jgi:hypothetical protein
MKYLKEIKKLYLIKNMKIQKKYNCLKKPKMFLESFKKKAFSEDRFLIFKITPFISFFMSNFSN